MNFSYSYFFHSTPNGCVGALPAAPRGKTPHDLQITAVQLGGLTLEKETNGCFPGRTDFLISHQLVPFVAGKDCIRRIIAKGNRKRTKKDPKAP